MPATPSKYWFMKKCRPSPGRFYQITPCAAFFAASSSRSSACAGVSAFSSCSRRAWLRNPLSRTWSMNPASPSQKPCDVEQAEGLGVIAERVPRPGLEQLVERADPAGQRDEPVAQLGHLRLALVHVGDGVQLGQAGMRDLMVDQCLRDNAIDLAARLQHRIGDNAHQAEPSAAIDHLDAAPGHLSHQVARHARRRPDRRPAPIRNKPRAS